MAPGGPIHGLLQQSPAHGPVPAGRDPGDPAARAPTEHRGAAGRRGRGSADASPGWRPAAAAEYANGAGPVLDPRRGPRPVAAAAPGTPQERRSGATAVERQQRRSACRLSRSGCSASSCSAAPTASAARPTPRSDSNRDSRARNTSSLSRCASAAATGPRASTTSPSGSPVTRASPVQQLQGALGIGRHPAACGVGPPRPTSSAPSGISSR